MGMPISITSPDVSSSITLSPGSTLYAGYILTLPSNSGSVQVDLTSLAVTLQSYTCSNGVTPSVSTYTLTMPSYSNVISDGASYPSSDPSSPSTYQTGAVTIPDLCSGGSIIIPQVGGAVFTGTLFSSSTSQSVSIQFHYGTSYSSVTKRPRDKKRIFKYPDFLQHILCAGGVEARKCKLS